MGKKVEPLEKVIERKFKDSLGISYMKKDPMKTLLSNEWVKGYLCAVANLIDMYGDSTMTTELYRCCPKSIKQMREIGVDERDIELLKSTVKEVQDRNKSLQDAIDKANLKKKGKK